MARSKSVKKEKPSKAVKKASKRGSKKTKKEVG